MSFLDENLSTSVTPTDAGLVSLGQRGFAYVADTTPTPGNFAAIQMVADTIFSSLTAINSTIGGLVGVTLTAGTIIYGPFTAFTLTSTGKVIAYKAG